MSDEERLIYYDLALALVANGKDKKNAPIFLQSHSFIT